MKKLILILSLVAGQMAHASALEDVARRVHANSSGKLVMVTYAGVEKANGESETDYNDGSTMILANRICDFTKNWNSSTTGGGVSAIFCIAK